MVTNGRHPKKAIAEAIKALNADLFSVEEIHKGHRWGVVTCLECGDDTAIWGSPKVPEHNASTIAKFAKNHTTKHAEEQR